MSGPPAAQIWVCIAPSCAFPCKGPRQGGSIRCRTQGFASSGLPKMLGLVHQSGQLLRPIHTPGAQTRSPREIEDFVGREMARVQAGHIRGPRQACFVGWMAVRDPATLLQQRLGRACSEHGSGGPSWTLFEPPRP